MESKTIILIGPEGAGKSTIGALLATSLAKPLYSLDRHRDALYAPYGYSPAVAQSIYDTHGLWAFYAHWTVFEFQAVCHILGNAARQPDEYFGKILDFGAGHSVYDNPEELAAVEALMAPFEHVFLVLPCEDVDEAARIMEARRGKELGLNRHFLTHESNGRLAKYTIYTKDRTPEECAKEILQILRRGSQSREGEEASLSTVV
ncbi:hypothetical protein LEL_00014 [Akanthomyces lecanii RCEF 1005]|uniref:Shikimate kinase n=1 Tax=Akanthomyces lecanii RCEF 1005 TaxID=1081108 RepID=A0A168JI54_CORDF|nr:hypothetical protein LEL_00014 [Akanthomyces lecanii RCEF 1005]